MHEWLEWARGPAFRCAIVFMALGMLRLLLLQLLNLRAIARRVQGRVVSAVGDDPVGDFVLRFLRQEGIGTDWVARKAGVRTGAAALAIEPPSSPCGSMVPPMRRLPGPVGASSVRSPQ